MSELIRLQVVPLISMFRPEHAASIDAELASSWGLGYRGPFKVRVTTADGAAHTFGCIALKRHAGRIGIWHRLLSELGLQRGDEVSVSPVTD